MNLVVCLTKYRMINVAVVWKDMKGLTIKQK